MNYPSTARISHRPECMRRFDDNAFDSLFPCEDKNPRSSPSNRHCSRSAPWKPLLADGVDDGAQDHSGWMVCNRSGNLTSRLDVIENHSRIRNQKWYFLFHTHGQGAVTPFGLESGNSILPSYQQFFKFLRSQIWYAYHLKRPNTNAVLLVELKYVNWLSSLNQPDIKQKRWVQAASNNNYGRKLN